MASNSPLIFFGQDALSPSVNSTAADDNSSIVQSEHFDQNYSRITLFHDHQSDEQTTALSTEYLDEDIISTRSIIPPRHCTNLCFFIPFVIAITLAFAAVVLVLRLNIDSAPAPPVDDYRLGSLLMTLLSFSIAITILVSCAVLLFTRHNGVFMLNMLIIASLFAILITAVVVTRQSWGYNTSFFVTVIVDCAAAIAGACLLSVLICSQRQIHFTAILLRYSLSSLMKFPGTVVFSWITAFFASSCSILLLWIVTNILTWYDADNHYVTQQQEHYGIWLSVGVIIVFFVIWDIFARIVSAVTAGVVGTFWHAPQQHSATQGAIRHVFRFHLGSIIASTLSIPVRFFTRVCFLFATPILLYRTWKQQQQQQFQQQQQQSQHSPGFDSDDHDTFNNYNNNNHNNNHHDASLHDQSIPSSHNDNMFMLDQHDFIPSAQQQLPSQGLEHHHHITTSTTHPSASFLRSMDTTDIFRSTIPHWVRYLHTKCNIYADINIMLYGAPYSISSRIAWDRVEQQRWDVAILYHNFAPLLVHLTAYIAASLSIGLSFLVVSAVQHVLHHEKEFYALNAIVSLAVSHILLMPLVTATRATLMSWAIDPEALHVFHPTAFAQIYRLNNHTHLNQIFHKR